MTEAEQKQQPPLTTRDFDKAKVRRWRRDVWRAFERAAFKPPEIMAAMVLAAVVCVGTDPSVVSALTGHSEDYARKVIKRLREQRIVYGRRVRAAWLRGDEFERELGGVLDGLAAAGIVSRRFVDPKRSAAQKARTPQTRARGPRKPRARIEPGTVAPPTLVRSKPYYGLPEWESGVRRSGGST